MCPERSQRPTWQGLFLRTLAMAHHFYVRSTFAELEADALRTQRDAAVEDNAEVVEVARGLVTLMNRGFEKVGKLGITLEFKPHPRVLAILNGPHPGTGYRAQVRAEVLRELAMERRAAMASGGVEVSNEALAEHFEAQAVEEEAAGGVR